MVKNIANSIAEMYPVLVEGVEYRPCIWNDTDGCYVGYRRFDDVPLKKVKVGKSTNKSIKEAILELQKSTL
jgi:hypothetical protein